MIKFNLFLLGLIVISVTSIAYCPNGCKMPDCNHDWMGYNDNISAVAVDYATCSCVTNEYIDNIFSWIYNPCKAAQSKENVQDITLILSEKSLNLLAFIAYDKARDWIVVSFRATICGKFLANVRLDLNFFQVDYGKHQCENRRCKIHKGFNHGYQNLVQYGGLLLQLRKFIQAHPKSKILVTGVSLGGALATIGAFDIANTFSKEAGFQNEVMAYTYGGPRVGNQLFAEAVNEVVKIYRVTNQFDPVPHMPPRTYTLSEGYYHAGIQVYFATKKNVLSKKEVPLPPKICSGDNYYCGSTAALLKPGFLFNGCNHLLYGNITYDLSKCTSTTCRPNDFTMSVIYKALEYAAVLRFFKSLLFGKKLDCGQSPQQLKCQNILLGSAASSQIPELSLLLPDSILSVLPRGASLPQDAGKYEKEIISAIDSELQRLEKIISQEQIEYLAAEEKNEGQEEDL